jgi:hypothetical protein
MRVNPILFGALVLVLFAGTLGTAMAVGAWQTTGRQGAGSGGGSGAASGRGSGSAGGTESGSEGSSAIGEIKGWMAIGDVATAAGIDLPEILAAFALPADTSPSSALKDLESDVFSVTALRTWVASRRDGAGAASDAPSAGTPAP